MNRIISDIKTVTRMAMGGGKGNTHAERLESFYSSQADAYDDFRKRLLYGREELYQTIPAPQGGVWIDMGGGTGTNLEALGSRIQNLDHVILVDLCPALLRVAKQRIENHNWSHVDTVEADVTTYTPPEGQADVVTFSYSLTMIPDWQKAIEQAYTILKPGGHIGIVDFYTSPKTWDLPIPCHSKLSRAFWPRWFAWAHVFLNAEHPLKLNQKFEPVHMVGNHGGVPYLPFMRMPYYQFIGKKSGE